MLDHIDHCFVLTIFADRAHWQLVASYYCQVGKSGRVNTCVAAMLAMCNFGKWSPPKCMS